MKKGLPIMSGAHGSNSQNYTSVFIGSKEDKTGWIRSLLKKEKPIFVALQETRLNTIDLGWICLIWGSSDCEFIQKEKVGNSGGQLLIWDSRFFEAKSVIRLDCVIGVLGIWRENCNPINILNIYGPHDDANKIKLWESINKILDGRHDAWVLCGDFNEVRRSEERFNCDFIEYRARRFNDFIAVNRLIDIPLGGRIFTRVCDDGTKFSKLGRFLINDIEHVIKEAWLTPAPQITRKDCIFRNKLKNVKNALRVWSRNKFDKLDVEIEALKKKSFGLELKAETTVLDEDELHLWRDNRKN
ncbi:uncharacterized protein [Rutidosis leptorrhynchoides]|uniref:uncharacterized protein n=1 Tax=Rutidosis leptorrhynchoides TaxID=125765 RepID=UPI003A9A0572